MKELGKKNLSEACESVGLARIYWTLNAIFEQSQQEGSPKLWSYYQKANGLEYCHEEIEKAL